MNCQNTKTLNAVVHHQIISRVRSEEKAPAMNAQNQQRTIYTRALDGKAAKKQTPMMKLSIRAATPNTLRECLFLASNVKDFLCFNAKLERSGSSQKSYKFRCNQHNHT